MPGEKSLSPAESRWAISMDWFAQNSRSATFFLNNYLCDDCKKRLRNSKKAVTPQSLAASIKKCCSQDEGFISQKSPVLESSFRIFLRNGNQPLTLNGLAAELAKIRPGDISPAHPASLLRLLKSDRYYGLQEMRG